MTDYISRDALLKELMLDPIGRMLIKRYNLDGFIKAQPKHELTEDEVIAYCIPRNFVIMAWEMWEHLKDTRCERHGTWVVHILRNDLAFCSECEMLVKAEDAKQFAYCPYCGAKMDGVKE